MSDYKDITINSLLIFIALVENNFVFKCVALDLNMHSASVSQSIDRLINRVGFKLFTYKKIKVGSKNRPRITGLTKKGEAFYADSLPLIVFFNNNKTKYLDIPKFLRTNKD